MTTAPATAQTTLLPAWLATIDAQRSMAKLVARTVADTLTAQFPGAAYLTLVIQEEDTPRDWHLFPESVCDAEGAVLFDFETDLPPLGPDHAELRAQWGGLDPGSALALRTVLRFLYINGAVFDQLTLRDTSGDDDEVLCLLLSSEARPYEWRASDDRWDVEARRLRPYAAANPQAAGIGGGRA